MLDMIGEIEIDGDAIADPWTRICVRCCRSFTATHLDQWFCTRRACRADKADRKLRSQDAHWKRRREHEKHIVGIDGEGINHYDETGKLIAHDYVVLGATGFEPLHKGGARLTLSDILHYLYYDVFQSQEAQHPGSVYCGFALGYDWGQWVRPPHGLPEDRARLLYTREGIASRKRTKSANPSPFPVYWREHETLEWELDFLGNNRLRMRPYTGQKRGPGIKIRNSNRWMYICDVFPFFQTSFLAVINPVERRKQGLAPYVSDADYKLIVEGKNRRKDAQFDLRMIEYNQAELRALSAVMSELDRGFVKNGVFLKSSQYFGPGQVAQQYLSNLNRPDNLSPSARAKGAKSSKVLSDVLSKTYQQHVPLDFRKAASASYFGGWFETFFHGKWSGISWESDINSAYPKVMTTLPCLLHGKYLSGRDNPRRNKQLSKAEFGTGTDKVLCLVYAEVKGSNHRIGAMPHRLDDGGVVRPLQTKGWFWLHEVDASQRAKLIDTVTYEQWHAYIPCDHPPPLASFADLYNDRIALGPNGKNSPEGVAKKLTYNSGYGKFAQSVGNPSFGNAVYSSLITAGCRCQILDFIATHPQGADAVLNIATDGIYTTSPHPGIEISETKLGAWEVKERSNFSIFKPGTYWDDKAREKIRDNKLDEIKMKTRGVPLRALAKRILEIDALFEKFEQGEGDWPKYSLNASLALYRHDRH